VGYALVVMAACSWGTWPLFLHYAEQYGPLSPALESAVLMAVLTVLSGPLCLRDRVRVRATRAQWLGVGWLGIADAFNVLLLFAAYQRTSVAIAVLTHYLTPILVALGAPLVVREPVRARTFVAVSAAMLGLLLLLSPWSAERHATDWVGAACGAGSAFFYASNVLVNKRLTPVFSGSELMFWHGVVATPLLIAMVPLSAWHAADPRGLFVVAGASVWVGTGGGLFFVWALRRIDASHASTLTLLEPLVAVMLAAALMHQPLDTGSGVGAALILTGAAAVVIRPRTD
jgi:drug/metabolite transporter (DMT)-like permease